MKIFIALSLLLWNASAHYTFGHLVVNKTITERWRFVRDVAPLYNLAEGVGKFWPNRDIFTSNITCGRDAFKAAPTTETADVVAGDEVGMYLLDWWKNETFMTAKSHTIGHYGPALAYLAKAPNDDLLNFSGVDADWFKIAYFGPKNDSAWSAFMLHGVNFTIPRTTPPGKYLLRIEQFKIDSVINEAQFYVNCAQLNIIGPGGGKPTELAKFPGTYKSDDPGLLVPVEMHERNQGLLRYVPPGPPVWKG